VGVVIKVGGEAPEVSVICVGVTVEDAIGDLSGLGQATDLGVEDQVDGSQLNDDSIRDLAGNVLLIDHDGFVHAPQAELSDKAIVETIVAEHDETYGGHLAALDLGDELLHAESRDVLSCRLSPECSDE
jgi:hypothetical protein